MGVCLLHCIFAVACAALMHSLVAYLFDFSGRGSCNGLGKECGDSNGYTHAGVMQDVRQMLSFALGAATCSFLIDENAEGRVDDANDDGGILRLSFEVVSFL